MSKALVIDYEVLFHPSKRHKANALSQFAARDILYECPNCNEERVVTWMFPDVSFEFVDKCCGVKVVLLPKEEE